MFELIIYSQFLFVKMWRKWMGSLPITTLGGFMVGLLMDIRVYVACIFILVIIDVITGISAALHQGIKFSSKKLRIGLIDRVILYSVLIIITLMLDTMLRGTINYGRDYIAIACCTIVGFYEASSCVENLIKRFPNYSFLQRIGKMLNLIEQKYEDSTVNKIADIIEASKLEENDTNTSNKL